MPDVPWYRRRRQLNVYVSPDTYDAITDYATRNGLTVSAVIEAIGRELADGNTPNLGASAFIERARAIVAERSARR